MLATLARGARRRARRPRRLHASADASRSCDRFPGRDRQRPPVAAAARSPARTRSTTRSPPASTTTGVTVHYVDEGIDTGAGDRQDEVPVEPRRDARRAHPRGRAPAAARGRERAVPPRADQRLRQDGHRRVRARARRARLGARLVGRHGGVPRGAGPRRHDASRR